MLIMPYIQTHYSFSFNSDTVLCRLLLWFPVKTNQNMQMATIYIKNVILGYECQSNPVLFVIYLTTLSVNQFWPKQCRNSGWYWIVNGKDAVS